MKKIIYSIRFATLLFILLAGCGSPGDSSPTHDVNDELTDRSTFLPTTAKTTQPTIAITPTISSVVPIPTPYPILPAAEAREKVAELIKAEDECRLPCWWGITPGVTTMAEVNQIVSPMAYRTGYDVSEKYFSFSFVYEFIDNSGNIDYTGADYISYHDGIVVDIRPQVDGVEERYALPKILADYGQPGEVWMWARTFLKDEWNVAFEMFYPELGILVPYHVDVYLEENDQNPNVQVCIYEPARNSTLILWWPDLNYTYYGAHYDTDLLQYYLPLEEAIGMDVATFYKTFIGQDDPVCIETPKDIWPDPFK